MKCESYQQAKEVLENLIPERNERESIANVYADLISHANEVGPKSWEVTVFRKGIRFNVGIVELFFLKKGGLYCLLRNVDNSAQIPGVSKTPHRRLFKSIKGDQFKFDGSIPKFLNSYERLKAGMFAWIDDCVRHRSISLEKRYFSPGFVEYISELSGKRLPLPGYYEPANALRKPVSYWVQYHNYEKRGCLPGGRKLKVGDDISVLTERDLREGWGGADTTKRGILKSVGGVLFLIVGIGKSPKRYYLWSQTRIDRVHKKDEEFIAVGNHGWVVNPPAFLNDVEGFSRFKDRCANFVGFRDISKDPFVEKLLALSENQLPLSDIGEFSELNLKDDIDLNEVEKINEKMNTMSPQRAQMVVDKLMRGDGSMVKMLKRISGGACQFPGCGVKILKKDGTYFSEVAHIEAMKDGGKSVFGNLLVLCPNHHKEFDHGTLEIEEQTPTLIKGRLNGKDFKIDLFNAQGTNNR